MTDKPIAGVDIAKEWLDICVDGGARVERIANSAEAAGPWLHRVGPWLVAVEPTSRHRPVPGPACPSAASPLSQMIPQMSPAFPTVPALKTNPTLTTPHL